MTTRASRAGWVALLLSAAFGCKPDPAPPDPKPAPSAPRALNATVTVGGDCNDFVDSESGTNTTTIGAGQTVTWAWCRGCHSTTSGTCCAATGVWDSGVMSPGSFTRTSPSPGVYPNFCAVHGSMMTGKVVVNPNPGGGDEASAAASEVRTLEHLLHPAHLHLRVRRTLALL